MQPDEQFRVLLFVGVVVTIYVLAAGILLRLVLRRFGRAVLPGGRRHVWYRRCVLGLATIGTCCVAYGFLVEPYWIDVKHVRITSTKLASGSRPIRIVHISDVHSDPKPRLESRLPEVIAREKPDLIVFTGDSINAPEGLPVFRSCLTKIAAIAPTFAVRGNWDTGFWSGLDLFGGQAPGNSKARPSGSKSGEPPSGSRASRSRERPRSPSRWLRSPRQS